MTSRKLGLLGAAALAVLVSISQPHAASALANSLQLQPLEYKETLSAGELKQGFIDVTNTRSVPLSITADVKGFKQSDDRGDLTFYDNQPLRDAITVDTTQHVIPAGKTLRIVFIVNASKLPAGDVFGVILVHSQTPNTGAVTPDITLGTLLLLTNGSPSQHVASINAVSLPWLSTSSSISGHVTITNQAPPNQMNGFFPTVTLQTWPFGPAQTIEAPLITSGISRTVDFTAHTNQVGLYKVSFVLGTHHTDSWIVLLPGASPYVLLTVIIGITYISIAIIRRRRTR